MLGGYPRLLTDARMTSKIVRCRGVSTESADREGRSGPALGLSLSIIRGNVVVFSRDFKHVFDACRIFPPGGRLNLSVSCHIVSGVCNSSITCSVFEHIIDYSSNK
jgi:hypothetical protein